MRKSVHQVGHSHTYVLIALWCVWSLTFR